MQSPLQLPKLLNRFQEFLNRSVQPAAQVHPRIAKTPLSPLVSKFGGKPYLKFGESLPTNPKAEILTFIAQLNFAELTARLPMLGEVLPTKGILQFFYDLEEAPWGGGLEDSAYWRVIFHPEPDLAHCENMTIPILSASEEASIEYSLLHSFPDVEILNELFTLSETEEEAYLEFMDTDDSSKHQVLGYPWSIQGDPCFEAQSLSKQLFPNSESAEPWHLLWQIDSDEVLDFMWGDMGMLYILIQEQDLRKADFSRVIFVLQCY
jgi:uncharacterized protein YwqG